MTFKELRRASGMNMTQFSKYFNIPYRTIQNWELGQRQCPEYLLELMKYKLEHEKIIKDTPKKDIPRSEPIISKELFNTVQYHRKSIKKSRTDDNNEVSTYHTRCSGCGNEVMCLDSVKEYLTDCPICGAKLDK